ncbi:MAG: hypothetical protein V4713_16680 [Pseudomonadota bacterium]
MSNSRRLVAVGKGCRRALSAAYLMGALLLSGCVSIKDYQLFLLVHVADQTGMPIKGAEVVLWGEFKAKTNSEGCAFIGGKVSRVDAIELDLKVGPAVIPLSKHSPGFYEASVVLDESGRLRKEEWRRIETITQEDWDKVCY